MQQEYGDPQDAHNVGELTATEAKAEAQQFVRQLVELTEPDDVPTLRAALEKARGDVEHLGQQIYLLRGQFKTVSKQAERYAARFAVIEICPTCAAKIEQMRKL